MSRSARVRPLAPMRAKSSRDRSVGTAPLRAGRASDGELLAATRSPSGEHLAATRTLHPRTKAVFLGAMTLLGLKCLLGHCDWGSSGQAAGRWFRAGSPLRTGSMRSVAQSAACGLVRAVWCIQLGGLYATVMNGGRAECRPRLDCGLVAGTGGQSRCWRRSARRVQHPSSVGRAAVECRYPWGVLRVGVARC